MLWDDSVSRGIKGYTIFGQSYQFVCLLFSVVTSESDMRIFGVDILLSSVYCIPEMIHKDES